jgi:hypothetical protein
LNLVAQKSGTKLVRLSRIAQPKTGEYLDLAETTAQAPNREASSRRAQISIEVGKAHEPHALGRKARNPALGQCPGRPDLRPRAVLFKDLNLLRNG